MEARSARPAGAFHGATLLAPVEPPSRYGVGTQARLFGMAGTCLVPLLLFGAMVLSWHTYASAPKPPTLSVYDVAAPAPASAPEAEAPPEPERESEPEPVRHTPSEQTLIAPPLITLPDMNRVAVVSAPTMPPQPQVSERPQPESPPPSAAPQPSNAKPTWEGSVLGALNKVKRYPRQARFARQQGVPYIRFVMDREGRVLSVTLQRSSGIPSLDQEALDLPRRAQPLPRPPAEVSGTTIELVVPVEFFLR